MSLIPSIEVDFDNLKNAKYTMKKLCMLLGRITDEDLYESMNEIKMLWTDENSPLLLKRTQQIADMLSEIQKSLSEIVDEIEKEAVTVFDAELFGRDLAINRSY